MDQANPIIISLMFVARCLVPLLIMLGISYLLRKWGLVEDAPPPPAEEEPIENNEHPNTNDQGGLAV